MKILLPIFLVLIPFVSFSQGGLLINAGNFRVEAGNVVIAGNGNWTNNGTGNCVSGSTVNFAGNELQTILGSATTSFSNITVNNSDDGIALGRNISVSGTVQIIQGSIDLKNYILDLSATGSVSGETETNRIKSTDGGGFEGFGTGIIRATRTLPAVPCGNIAGLGLNITPGADMGNTVIIRGSERQQGSGYYTGNYSVFRYYELQPTTVSTLTINNFYYMGGAGNPELNGHAEANLQMFQKVNYGGPTYWEARNTVVNAGSDFISSTTENNAVSGAIRITLGSTTSPLPIELISFYGKCNNIGIKLHWQTASENNNDYFQVEKSPDAKNFSAFIKIPSYGNSNGIQNYYAEDLAPYNGTNYYRLHQFDIDGAESYSEIIGLNCKAENYIEDILPVSPSNYNVEAIVLGIPGNLYRIKLTTVLGQVISNKEIVLTDSRQYVRINDTNLPNGVYYLIMQCETKNISKSVVVNN